MSSIKIQNLETIAPSAIDSDYYALAFTNDGDTNKVLFEDAVAQANANNGCLCVKKVSFTIDAADVLDLNVTPQYFLGPLGADRYPDFIDVTLEFANGSTAYDTNIDAEIKHFGATNPIFENTTILGTNGGFAKMTRPAPTSSAGDFSTNTGVYIWSPTGAPATGDYDIIVHATYVEVDVS